MASNSLLECIVYGRATAKHIAQTSQTGLEHATFIPWDASQVVNSDEDVVIAHNWAEIRDSCGIMLVLLGRTSGFSGS